MPNFLKVGQAVAEIWRLNNFQNGRLGFVGPPQMTTWWYIDVQNLVGIDAVVLIVCNFQYFVSGYKTHIHTPKMGILGEFHP